SLASTFFSYSHPAHRHLHSFPTRRSSDLIGERRIRQHRLSRPRPGQFSLAQHLDLIGVERQKVNILQEIVVVRFTHRFEGWHPRSEEHTSELQSRGHLVCRLLLEKKK